MATLLDFRKGRSKCTNFHTAQKSDHLVLIFNLRAGVGGDAEKYNPIMMEQLTFYMMRRGLLNLKLETLKCYPKAARSLSNMPKALSMRGQSDNLLANDTKFISPQYRKRAQFTSQQNFLQLQ